jgi:beta-glucosidase
MPATFDAAGNASGAQFKRGFGLDYQSKPSTLAVLSEDPAIPPRWLAPEGSLFHAGHVTAPWSIFVADDSAEVHLTTSHQGSPKGAVSVELAPNDKGGARGTWTGKGLGIWRFSGRAVDLRRQVKQGAVLKLRYRVDRMPEKPVKVGMRCAEALCGSTSGAMLDMTDDFKSAAPGTWHTIATPLSRLTGAGADLKDVVIPLAIETSGRFTLSISEARLAPRSESETPDPDS